MLYVHVLCFSAPPPSFSGILSLIYFTKPPPTSPHGLSGVSHLFLFFFLSPFVHPKNGGSEKHLNAPPQDASALSVSSHVPPTELLSHSFKFPPFFFFLNFFWGDFCKVELFRRPDGASRTRHSTRERPRGFPRSSPGARAGKAFFPFGSGTGSARRLRCCSHLVVPALS